MLKRQRRRWWRWRQRRASAENKMNMHIKHYSKIIIFILINCFGISGCAKQIKICVRVFFSLSCTRIMTLFSWKRANIVLCANKLSQLLFLIKNIREKREKCALLNGHIIYVIAWAWAWASPLPSLLLYDWCSIFIQKQNDLFYPLIS